ncbi:hypothetical protein Q3G72_022507 [Acer saccharum]|nr:hypothetical protein Q3G72_022507 [Acer saccharum]
MGFSVLGSFGCSHVLVRNSCHGSVKFQALSGKERFGGGGGGGFVSFSKLKTWRGRALACSKSEFVVDFEDRTSPHEVRKEIERCYELIHRLGRGIANLLDCTTWSGAGPGLMDAVTKGALEAGKPVGGFKIGKEAGEWTASNFHPYLPSESYLTCRFFSVRKHGLVDAVVRSSSSGRTAVVALPGGIGTLDEMFEIYLL